MPRFFFDLHDDMDVADQEGIHLPDRAAAQTHGLNEAREMICASVSEQGRVDLEHHIDIRDDSGALLSRVTFAEAVQFVRKGAGV